MKLKNEEKIKCQISEKTRVQLGCFDDKTTRKDIVEKWKSPKIHKNAYLMVKEYWIEVYIRFFLSSDFGINKFN